MPSPVPSPTPDLDAASNGLTFVLDVLPIVSLVVAVISLVYALGWRARPYLTVEYSQIKNNDAESEGNPTWSIGVANRGNGAALDVRLDVRPDDGTKTVVLLGTLEPGQRKEATLMLSPFEPFDPNEPDGSGAWSSVPADPTKASARLRWRQPPILRLYRRKRIRAHKVRFENHWEIEGDSLFSS